MTARGGLCTPRVAAGLTVASGVLVLAALTATLAVGPAARVWTTLGLFIPIGAYSAVGGVIAWRRSRNAIGWVLSVIGLLLATVIACSSISAWGLKTGTLPQSVGEWISVGSRFWVIPLGLIGTQLLLRLPDGTLLSPRWTAYSRGCMALIVVAWVGMSVQPGRVEDVAGTANPLGIAGAEPLKGLFLLVVLSFIGAIGSLFLRYRRTDPHDRAQLRWIAFGGLVFLAIYVAGFVIGIALDVTEDSRGSLLVVISAQAAFAALPIAIGHAVLRRSLYDIDVVINRTLVYGAMTATLAATYLGSVLLLQLLLGGFTEGSSLAVAASTLAVAALFRPVRSRIQATVDRRFFRRKYDAERTLREFSARLRDEVDIGTLEAELSAVVRATLQPEHVSLWLRAPEDSR